MSSGTHLLLLLLQVVVGLPKAVARCSSMPGGFLERMPPRFFAAFSEALDWCVPAGALPLLRSEPACV